MVMFNDILIDGNSAEGHVAVPIGIKVIADSAFEKSHVTQVEIPRTVTHIGARAFYRCEDLEAVHMNSKPQIEKDAFLMCPLLLEMQR